MTTLTNSFEGGTSGTTISTGNSGGTSGNAFDNVTIGASATLTFDNTHAAHGSLAGDVTTPAVAASSYAAWTTSMGSQAQVWFRIYLYYTANPTNTHRVWTAVQGGTNCGSLQVTTAGKLQWINTSNVTILTSTATIPTNAWFRVEGFLIGSATVGQVEVKLFTTPDSTTAAETDTSAATQNTLGNPNGYRFGVSGTTASVSFWMDDLGLSSTGYIGPVSPPAASPGRPAQVARLPQPQFFPRGRASANAGAPVQNPTSGPVFRQAVQAVRARLPRPQFFPRGRVSGNRGGPVRNPTSGPVFRPDTVMQAQRAVIPQRPRGGRVASNPGGPVQNPVAAVVLAQAGASLPPATRNPYSRLIVAISPPAAPPPTDLILIAGESSPNSVIEPAGASVPAPLSPRSQLLPNPVWQGPQFFPAVQAVRARFPLLPLLRGRVASNPGAPVRNPVAGPVFRQAVQALHAIRTLPLRGRTWSGPGAPVPPPAASPSSPGGPARARILPPLRGRTGSSRTAPAIPPIPARILVTAGQPYTRWETGQLGQAARGLVPGPPVPGPAVPGMAVPGAFTPGYPGAPTRILVTAGQPYTRWETGQPAA